MLATLPRILKNTFSAVFLQNFSRLATFLFYFYLARLIGVEQFGIFTYALTVITLSGVIAQFGMVSLVIRDAARDKTRSNLYLCSMTVVQTVLGAIVAIGTVIFVILHQLPPLQANLIYTFTIYMVASNVVGGFVTLFRAYEKLEYEAYLAIAENLVLVGAGVYLLSSGFSIMVLPWLYLICTVLFKGFFGYILYQRYIGRLTWQFDFSFAWELLKKAYPFALSWIAGSLVLKFDIIMLEAMTNITEVGFYSAATRLVEALFTIGAGFGLAIYPVLAKYYVENPEFFRKNIHLALRFVITWSIPLVLSIAVLSKIIINLIYGSSFLLSSSTLAILVWYYPMWLVRLMLSYTIRCGEKVIIDFYGAATGVIINIALNLIFIPYWQAKGAAIASVITEFIIIVYFYQYLYRKGLLKPFFKVFAAPALALILCLPTLIWRLPFAYGNYFALALNILLIYPLTLWIFRYYNKEDYKIIKDGFRKWRAAEPRQ